MHLDKQWDKLLLIVSMQVRLCCGMALDALTACGTGIAGEEVNPYPRSVKTIISKDPRAIDRRRQRPKRSEAAASSRTAGSKGDTVGMVWAASSTAAAIYRYCAAGLPPAGLHTPCAGGEQ